MTNYLIIPIQPTTTAKIQSQPKERKPRKKFSESEDKKLIALVNKYGTTNWYQVSQSLNGRTSRQCRERYCNYLMPGNFNGQWTTAEDNLLFAKFRIYGPRWTFMSQFFTGRSANSLKNRWNYYASQPDYNPNMVFEEPSPKREEERPKTVELGLPTDFSNRDVLLKQLNEKDILQI